MQEQRVNVYKTPRIVWSALLAIVCAFPFVAQSQTDPALVAQVEILKQNVETLKLQVFALEDFQKDTLLKLAQLEQSQKEDQQKLADLEESKEDEEDAEKDEARLTALEARVRSLESAPKNPSANTKVGNRVTAPFQVVDSSGKTILDVEAGADTFRGLRVYSQNQSFAQIGTHAETGYANVSVHLPGHDDSRVVMGMYKDGRPVIGILNDSGIATTEITEENGGGDVRFANSGGLVTALVGNNPKNDEGHANFYSAAGNPMAEIGAAGNHGDVLLGSAGGKEVWVWEMTLTGFH